MKGHIHSQWTMRLGALLVLVLFLALPAAATELVRLLQDTNVGPVGSSPSNFVKMGDFVYFYATDAAHGKELWKTDGTEGGATLVADINVGPSSSLPSSLTVIGDTLFFTASDGTNGRELWKSDGTEGGTEMVADIFPGSKSSSPSALIDVNGMLYFTADDGTYGTELWKSDGTADGTEMVTTLAGSGYYAWPQELTVLDGTLFFVMDDGTHGRELYKIDEYGKPSLVKDIAADSAPMELTPMNGYLYFSASDSANDRELWRSDGTEAGTERVKDICPTLSDPPGCFCGYAPTPGVIYASSSPQYLTAVEGMLFFSACTESGIGLWKSDGTPAGTELVKPIAGGSVITPIGHLTAVEDTLFFSALILGQSGPGTITGRELWKSDGTEGGTYPLKDICLGNNGGCGPAVGGEPTDSSNPYELTAVGATLYFSAYSDDIEVGGTGHVGRELWKSDGTPEGTTLVIDICRSELGCSSNPSGLTTIDHTLYFSAFDNDVGSEPWRLDTLWVDAGGPYDVPEGGSLTLTADGAGPQDGTVVFHWDLDEDGDYETEGPTVTFSATDKDGPSSVTVKSRITDEASGVTEEEEAVVQVSNVAPLVDAGDDVELFEGESLELAVNFDDPGPDTWTATVDFADGSLPQEIPLTTKSFTIGHAYSTAGVFDVTVSVADDDGGMGWDSVRVSVLTPQQGIDGIIRDVLDFIDQDVLEDGQGNSLIVKLEAAIASLDKGNPVPAINQLEAFVNQVTACMASGILTEEQGQPLIDKTLAVIATLQP